MQRNLLCLFSLNISFCQAFAFQESAEDTSAIHAVVRSYYDGLSEKNVDKVLATVREDFFMFNGNFSGEPENWQAHLYLRGKDLTDWVPMFVEQAGPHENQIEFLNSHIRANAAVVVTSETGRNKFRSWENEKVTWLLGKGSSKWKLIGFFIRNIKNPE